MQERGGKEREKGRRWKTGGFYGLPLFLTFQFRTKSALNPASIQPGTPTINALRTESTNTSTICIRCSCVTACDISSAHTYCTESRMWASWSGVREMESEERSWSSELIKTAPARLSRYISKSYRRETSAHTQLQSWALFVGRTQR
jgi:hypothetical protein